MLEVNISFYASSEGRVAATFNSAGAHVSGSPFSSDDRRIEVPMKA